MEVEDMLSRLEEGKEVRIQEMTRMEMLKEESILRGVK